MRPNRDFNSFTFTECLDAKTTPVFNLFCHFNRFLSEGRECLSQCWGGNEDDIAIPFETFDECVHTFARFGYKFPSSEIRGYS